MRANVWLARALAATAAVLLLAGVVLRVAPPDLGATSPAERTAAPSAVPPGPAPEPPGVTATIAAGNLFSAARTPPRVRYTPPDLVPAKGPAPAARRRPTTPSLRLFGTVVGPSGTAALIDADSAVRGAEIYQVGDEVDGRRIVAVSESTVVLEGAAGRTVLRLHPAR